MIMKFLTVAQLHITQLFMSSYYFLSHAQVHSSVPCVQTHYTYLVTLE
jgi:hypothetical protein